MIFIARASMADGQQARTDILSRMAGNTYTPFVHLGEDVRQPLPFDAWVDASVVDAAKAFGIDPGTLHGVNPGAQ